MIYIYALQDPLTAQIRYIGKTVRLKERLMNQCNERSSTYRCHWIQSLVNQGLKPVQIILESLPDDSEWEERERFWIAYGKSQGWPLTNGTEGGDGVKGLSEESRRRMTTTWIGRKHKPETIELYRRIRKGRTHTQEAKEYMRKKMKGRVFTETHRARLSKALAKLTDNQVREIRKLLSERVSQYTIADQFKVHQGTISNIKRGISYADVI